MLHLEYQYEARMRAVRKYSSSAVDEIEQETPFAALRAGRRKGD